MDSNIVPQNCLPRAIAKEKDGIVLYWIEELGIAGIHIRGIATLLGCNASAVTHAIASLEAEQQVRFIAAETVTSGGIQGVKLLDGRSLAKLLRHIARSKAKLETRDRADDVRDRLVEAGFQIGVLIEVAPAELAARAVNHLAEQLKLERIKNEGRAIERDTEAIRERAQNFRHYVVTALPKPTADRILGVTEVKDIEYRDRVFVGDRLLRSGDTLTKTELCGIYGITTKNGAPDFKRLNRELGGLNIPDTAWEETETIHPNRELKRSYLPELDRALYTAEQRQLWIGESHV